MVHQIRRQKMTNTLETTSFGATSTTDDVLPGVNLKGQRIFVTGAATSVWAAVVASADEISGQYCEDCHVARVIPDDLPVSINESVRGYAVDPNNADALWEKSEEVVGELF